MKKQIAASLICLLLAACSGSGALTEAERQKLDPQLTRLMLGEPERDAESGTRLDGTKEYEVIIRSTNAEEVKQAGIKIGSAFGDVITARVTVAELKKILALSSVRAVQASSKNRPQ